MYVTSCYSLRGPQGSSSVLIRLKEGQCMLHHVIVEEDHKVAPLYLDE